MKKLFIFFIAFALLAFFYNQAEAQSDKRKAKKLIKEADEYYNYREFPLAIPLYEDAVKLQPDNAETHYKLGVSYIESVGKRGALAHFEKAYQLDEEVADDILLRLADSYHIIEEFDRAIAYYDKYKEEIKKDENMIAYIDRKIYECENGKEFIKNPVDIEIQNLGGNVNSKYKEYAPVVSADESILVFTSRRPGGTSESRDEYGMYYEDIYLSRKVGDKWGTPENLSNINSNVHEASVGLSPDGKKLIIFKGDEGYGDLFYCKQKEDGTWAKPKSFPKQISGKKTYEPSATISSDGKTLFFASNRDDGYGGIDIYKVTREDADLDEWSEPENLGPVINDMADQDSPFLDIDGKTLYFSSKSHKGMGGFDIFKSVYDESSNTWSEPENLGYPINSTEDDIFFVLSGDGRHAYFNSVKKGGYGDDDLYRFKMPEREDLKERIALIEEVTGNEYNLDVEEEIVEEVVIEEEVIEEKEVIEEEVVLLPVMISGTVKETETGNVISNAKVQLMDTNGKPLETKYTDNDGTYEFDVASELSGRLSVSAEKESYIYQTRNVEVPEPTEEQQTLTVNLNLKKPKTQDRFILRNIYFDFDKHSLKAESYTELDKLVTLLNENPSIKATIEGHTDKIGSHDYNMQLSRKRSNAVRNYLISKNISPERIEAKGLGETKPLASNDDEDEGRELNRRTEFVIDGL